MSRVYEYYREDSLSGPTMCPCGNRPAEICGAAAGCDMEEYNPISI